MRKYLLAPSIKRSIIIFFITCIVPIPFGCSIKSIENTSSPEKVWKCDAEADRALQSHRYQDSIILHKQFLEKQADNGMALYHLGYAIGRLGDHMGEIEHYEQAVKTGYIESHIFFNLGMSYGEIGKHEKAIKIFKKGLSIYPDDIDIRIGLATAFFETGNRRKAMELIQKVIKISPKDEMAMDLLNRINIEKE